MGDIQHFGKLSDAQRAGTYGVADAGAEPARASDYALLFGVGTLSMALTVFGAWKVVELLAHI
ncbi:hypothetical protein [Parvibaculum sp.]|uniref:hypothetical protein n=1 Tax=Parvibaculum sp. TaxID=2024848 RepID=UPI002BE9F495|nr:hypothetical protein [Parvibaculum sp.]HUD53062.1 hypothetical protein [Parvibaculum sp.]